MSATLLTAIITLLGSVLSLVMKFYYDKRAAAIAKAESDKHEEALAHAVEKTLQDKAKLNNEHIKDQREAEKAWEDGA